jgi:hypothetical protein
MNQRWSDEELDLALRGLFSQARQPVAPPTLRVYPRNVVAEPRRPGFGGFAHVQTRGLAAVAATLAIAVVVASAALMIKPGAQTGSSASPSKATSSPLASASISNSIGLPDQVTAGGFVWTRLSLPTPPVEILPSGAVMTKFGWVFFRAAGITFGVDCAAAIPGQIWTSTDDLNWALGGLLPGAEVGEGPCPSDVIWDGSRFVVSGTIFHTLAPNTPVATAIWTSADAKSWTRITLPANLPKESWSVVFGKGAYVGLGDDELWRSTDLAHWSKVQALPAGSSFLRFDGSAFVAADPTGNSFAYSSNDGLTWTRADLGGSILTLVARPSSFVALVNKSDAVVAMGSANGRTWTQLGTLPAVVGDQCNWGMLLCGKPGSTSEPWLYSIDGLSWQAVPWPAGLPSGDFEWGPSPDPIFITVMNGSGAAADSAVYVIQRQP